MYTNYNVAKIASRDKIKYSLPALKVFVSVQSFN